MELPNTLKLIDISFDEDANYQLDGEPNEELKEEPEDDPIEAPKIEQPNAEQGIEVAGLVIFGMTCVVVQTQERSLEMIMIYTMIPFGILRMT